MCRHYFNLFGLRFKNKIGMKMLKKIWDQGIPILIPFQDFLSTSTFHGLSHIASAKSLVVQILWLVIVSLGFGFAIHSRPIPLNSSFRTLGDQKMAWIAEQSLIEVNLIVKLKNGNR